MQSWPSNPWDWKDCLHWGSVKNMLKMHPSHPRVTVGKYLPPYIECMDGLFHVKKKGRNTPAQTVGIPNHCGKMKLPHSCSNARRPVLRVKGDQFKGSTLVYCSGPQIDRNGVQWILKGIIYISIHLVVYTRQELPYISTIQL